MDVVAVDWSGKRGDDHRSIWTAEVHEGALVALENGRHRSEVVEHLVSMAARCERLVVGFDFAFSFPAWYLSRLGVGSASELWTLAATEGEAWLAACDPPFWGRPGRTRPALEEHFRRTEREFPAVAGVRPKSVFQIGGAGAVGTGSVRGMPMLARLSDEGFSIWPFDSPRWPLVIEIYPRQMTGPIVKSSRTRREECLAGRYPGIDPVLRSRAVASEDAFDAAVSALVMAEHAGRLQSLRQPDDAVSLLEGTIWTAPAGGQLAFGDARPPQRSSHGGDG